MDLSLLQDFIAETGEHLEEMETSLLRLEEEPGNREYLNDIFRCAHTIKGSAEYLGMEKIGELSHKLENLLEILRHGEHLPDREIIDTLIDTKDRIDLLNQDLEQAQTESTKIEDIVQRIDRIAAAADSERGKEGDSVHSRNNQQTELQLSDFSEDRPQQEYVCDVSDTDVEKIRSYYDKLKVVLYEMNNGEMSDENRRQVEELLEAFVRIAACTEKGTLRKNLENLRTRAGMLSFPDDAGDMLADLHRLMVSLAPQSYGTDLSGPSFSNTSPDDENAVEQMNNPEADTDVTEDGEEEEIYDEEYDDELFGIFIDHLKENVSLIIDRIKQFDGPDSGPEFFDKCFEYVEGLHSSANYMDYKKLILLYEQWMRDIETAREKLALGEEFSIRGFSDPQKGMNAYVAEIAKRFSKFMDEGVFPENGGPDAGLPGWDDSENDLKSVSGDSDESVADIILSSPEKDVGDLSVLFLDEDPKENFDEESENSEKRDEVDLSTLFLDEDPEPGEKAEQSLSGLSTVTDSTEVHSVSPELELMSGISALGQAQCPAETEEKKESPDQYAYKGLMDELDDVFEAPESAQIPEPEPEVYPGDLEEKLAASAGKPWLPSTGGETDVPRPTEKEEADTPLSALPTEKDAVVPPVALPTEQDAAIPLPTEQDAAVPPVALPTEKADEPETMPPADEPPRPEVSLKKETDPSEKFQPSEQKGQPDHLPVKHTFRVDAGKIDALMNQVGELVVSRAWFSQLHTEIKELQDYLQESAGLEQRDMKAVKALTFRISEATVALGRVANELQEGVMKVRMLPIAQLFNRYPRLLRDLTNKGNKNVRLEIVGEDTELDKMVIEEISDPLIHIIRNAVDHGCETIAERRQAQKPDECMLRLESYHESNHVVIEITDDGRGIDPVLVKQKAVEKNFFSPDEVEHMTHRDLMGIIMKPGFSTAREISKTSGRGVGMDVVQKNIEKLNGTIEIDSKPGAGTRFRIKIPLTLAIIQALLVRVGSEIFTIPLAAVEETLRVFESEITIIEGIEVIHLRDSTLSMLRLSEIFCIESAVGDVGKLFVVVVNTGIRRVGLVVDALIGQEETVIKPLVDYLQENSGFSGATILGDGRISLILDVYELVNMSIGRQVKRKNEMILPSGMNNGAHAEASGYESMAIH